MVAIILCSAIFFLMLIIFSHVFCLQALISIYTAKNSTGCYSVVTVLFNQQRCYHGWTMLFNKQCCSLLFQQCYSALMKQERLISNSFIIHEENTKEIDTEMEFGYVMKHLHKIKPTFISIFSLNTDLFEMLYQTLGRVFDILLDNLQQVVRI